MDSPRDHLTRRNNGPWRFFTRRCGLTHVVIDADGQAIACNVPAGCGPLLAAGPDFLAALQRVASLAPGGSAAHEVAVDAIERFGEAEGMALADWKPAAASRRPALRIVVVAT